MVSHGKFFSDDKGAAAVLKHGILNRYAAKFLAKTSSTSVGHKVGFLDGYAGHGEYVNPISGVIGEGSPRIVLNIAQALRASSGREPHLVFVEKDNRAYSSLQHVVSSSGYPHARALHGDVSIHLQSALDSFAGMPALVFLDPFGSALDHEVLVERILKRPGNEPTEVLLNFSLQTLRRIGGRLSEPVNARGRESTLARVDTWLGGDWWREYFTAPEILFLPPADRPNAAAMSIAHAHAARVNKATRCGYFSVEVARKPGEKPLFLLTLYFPRQIAVFDYNEAVSMAQSDWRKFLHSVECDAAEREDSRDPQLFSRVDELKAKFEIDEAQIKVDAESAIKAAIRRALEKRETLTVRNDFGTIMGPARGTGRQMHLRAAWKELANEGLVETCPSGVLDSSVITRAN